MSRRVFDDARILDEKNYKQQAQKQQCADIGQRHVESKQSIHENGAATPERDAKILATEHGAVATRPFVFLESTDRERVNSDILRRTENVVENHCRKQQLEVGMKVDGCYDE